MFSMITVAPKLLSDVNAGNEESESFANIKPGEDLWRSDAKLANSENKEGCIDSH